MKDNLVTFSIVYVCAVLLAGAYCAAAEPPHSPAAPGYVVEHWETEFAAIEEEIREIPRPQRYASRSSLETLFPHEKVIDKQARDRTAYAAHVNHGYSLKEIAEHLGVHYVTVSRAIVKMENE